MSCKGMSDLIKNINREDSNNSMSTTAEEELTLPEHTTTTLDIKESQPKIEPLTIPVQDQERSTTMEATTTATMKEEISSETDSTPAGEETTETKR